MNCMILLKKNIFTFSEISVKNGRKYNDNKLSLEYYDYESDEQPDERPDEQPDQQPDTTNMSDLEKEESDAQMNNQTPTQSSRGTKILTSNQMLIQLPVALV